MGLGNIVVRHAQPPDMLRFMVWASAPFSLLVPVFGMSAAAVLTDETITPTLVVAGVIVIAGVLTGLVQRPKAKSTRPMSVEHSGL